MKRKVRRNRSVKFTGRKFSKRGLVALLIGIAAVISMIVVVRLSYLARGSADVYVGSIGLASMFAAAASIVTAISALRQEDTYKTVPAAGLIIGILSTAGWITIYVGGFIG